VRIQGRFQAAETPWTIHFCPPSPAVPWQILNTLTSGPGGDVPFRLVVAVPVLYASTDDSGRSNRLILPRRKHWLVFVSAQLG